MDNSTSPTPLPPRGERFSDPGSRAVWAAITVLPIVEQHLIHDALRQLLGSFNARDSHDARVRHAIAALRECAERLGHSPSIGEYRRLRAEDPSLGWPPDASMRRWLGGGSWNDCLTQARLESVPDGDVVVAQLGSALSAEEITQALRDCARETGSIPTLHTYLGWARRPDVLSRPGRRPGSQHPFVRAFKGFRGALAASGLINEDIGERSRADRIRVAAYFVDDETCAVALRQVADRLGRSPRLQEYLAERELLIEEAASSGELKSLPAPSTIQKRFGRWDDALASAGLAALGGRRTGKRGPARERKPPRTSNAELVAALVEAYQHPDVGEPFTGAAYRAWRKAQIARDRGELRLRTIAGYDLVWTRLGSWSNGVKAVYRALEFGCTTPELIESRIDAILDGLLPEEGGE
jgi:hypothetical protein